MSELRPGRIDLAHQKLTNTVWAGGTQGLLCNALQPVGCRSRSVKDCKTYSDRRRYDRTQAVGTERAKMALTLRSGMRTLGHAPWNRHLISRNRVGNTHPTEADAASVVLILKLTAVTRYVPNSAIETTARVTPTYGMPSTG